MGCSLAHFFAQLVLLDDDLALEEVAQVDYLPLSSLPRRLAFTITGTIDAIGGQHQRDLVVSGRCAVGVGRLGFQPQ